MVGHGPPAGLSARRLGTSTGCLPLPPLVSFHESGHREQVADLADSREQCSRDCLEEAGRARSHSIVFREGGPMSRSGSLGYQMMRALQRIFRPGHSRHQDKRYKRTGVIRSIRTMRDMCGDVHRFGHFVRQHNPAVHGVHDVTSEMACAFIQDLADRGRSRAYLTRNRASLRKLDRACRAAGIFPADREELMPLPLRTTPRANGARAVPRTYSPADAQRLITVIHEKDETIADVLSLMFFSGLRVSEAVYLRAEDIHPEESYIVLEANANHTKGGRPRRVSLPSEAGPLLEQLRARGLARPDGHVFTDRRQLHMRAKDLVRHTCPKLNIACLGTHGFRKSFAAAEYLRAIHAGATDRQALLIVSHQLGHNRIQVAATSYVPPEIRVNRLRSGRPRRTSSQADEEQETAPADPAGSIDGVPGGRHTPIGKHFENTGLWQTSADLVHRHELPHLDHFIAVQTGDKDLHDPPFIQSLLTAVAARSHWAGLAPRAGAVTSCLIGEPAFAPSSPSPNRNAHWPAYIRSSRVSYEKPTKALRESSEGSKESCPSLSCQPTSYCRGGVPENFRIRPGNPLRSLRNPVRGGQRAGFRAFRADSRNSYTPCNARHNPWNELKPR